MFDETIAMNDRVELALAVMFFCAVSLTITYLFMMAKANTVDHFARVLEKIITSYCPPDVLHGVDEDFFEKYRCAQVIDTQIRQFRNNQRICFVTLRVGLEGNDEDQTTVFAISETTQFILDLDKLRVGDNVLLCRAIGPDDQPRIIRDTEGGA